MTLHLLRHGQTTFSRDGGFCGALEPELTEIGHAMARQFAERHAEVPWTALYASPQVRARQTIGPLCARLDREATVHEGLAEIRFGQWEGLSVDEVKRQWPAEYARWVAEPAWNAAPGGERAVDVAARALTAVREVSERFPDGDVLIVSHKATIRLLLCALLGIELGRYRDRLDLPAGSIARVRLGVTGPLLLSLGDRGYLDETLRAAD